MVTDVEQEIQADEELEGEELGKRLVPGELGLQSPVELEDGRHGYTEAEVVDYIQLGWANRVELA